MSEKLSKDSISSATQILVSIVSFIPYIVFPRNFALSASSLINVSYMGTSVICNWRW